VTESQSADAEPPPPPKPDLSRYTGLRTHLTLATNEGKEGMQGPSQPLGGKPRAVPGRPGARAAGTGCGVDLKHVSTAALWNRVHPCLRAATRSPCDQRSLWDASSRLYSIREEQEAKLRPLLGSEVLVLSH